jgi:hypothetical protein
VSLESLQTSVTSGARVHPNNRGWRFEIPTGPAGSYRLAQLDDYRGLPRKHFLYQPPLQLSLRARASAAALPGTWGFGLWNDPFSLSLGFGGGRRFPALPNTAWFFFASSENHLSLKNRLPGNGSLAAVYRSPALPAPLLGLAVFSVPLLILRPLSRLLRRAASGIIRQDVAELKLDPTIWHTYRLNWELDNAAFEVDGKTVMRSSVSPRGPLGLVIWLDNQYAAWKADGRLAYGTLPTPEDCWIEIEDLKISQTP